LLFILIDTCRTPDYTRAHVSPLWGSFLETEARQWKGRSLIPSALLDARRYLRKPRAQIEGDIRFFSSILLFLALVRLRSVHVGRRLIKTRSNPDALANLPLKALMLVTGTVAVGLALFGAIHVPSAELSSRYLISVFLGLLGVADVRRDWRFLANPRPTPMAW
jgi:hypothetical protein